MDLWRRGEQPPNSQLAEVLVQLRLRRGREGTDLAFEARRRRHDVDVAGEVLGVSVGVGDVLEEVLLGVGLEGAPQALELDAGDAPLQVHPLDALPLRQRSCLLCWRGVGSGSNGFDLFSGLLLPQDDWDEPPPLTDDAQ